MSSPNYHSEVLIVGAGIAGMITALELLDAGKRVLLLDRDAEAELGGLAKWAFGGMFFVDTKHQRRNGIKDSLERAKQDWYNFAQFDDNEVHGKAWADQYINLCTPHGY
ncbi:MAG: FAD-dependent oxidoreductase, partial [Bacteroidota bacterium]